MLLLISVLFTGCIDQKNIIIPTESSQDIEADETDEFADEFEDDIEEESDPFEGYNIVMTDFNDGFYRNVFAPTAKGYNYIVPKEARNSVDNFFHNLLYPLRLINNIFQAKFVNATEETGRFIVNSTVGLFGLFDPAKSYLDLESHNEDFGQTLGYWGVGSGYHIVLPFLGPSNMRDAFSMYPNSLASPISYQENSILITTYQKFNYGSLHQGEYEDLTKDAVSLYPFLRDVYEQYRDKQIKE